MWKTESLMVAVRGGNVETVRGVVKIDEFGNAIGDVYIRKVTRSDGRLGQFRHQDLSGVSQFWTMTRPRS